jgi:hypothetical protein
MGSIIADQGGRREGQDGGNGTAGGPVKQDGSGGLLLRKIGLLD